MVLRARFPNKPQPEERNHMKSIITFLAAISFVGAVWAQEESPAPAAEEKASATVETTPSTAEAPSPSAKASEPTKESTAAAPKKAASPAAAATTAKKGAAEPAATSKAMGKNMSVKDMENAWEAAVGKHDYATVEGMLAADFMGVTLRNKFANRSQMLSESKGDKDTYKSAKNEKLNVQMYGKDVAVVTGRAREVGTGKDGKAFDRTFLFTDTWMMRGGKWQCIASQASKIKG
jgi:ketosteroid isomerase-like protein